MDARIDVWERRRVEPQFAKIRAEVAPLIGAEVGDVVLVPNTTHGVNTIVYNLDWAPGDVILAYASTYNAVSQMVKHIADKYEGVRIEIVDVAFPCLHSEIVEATEKALATYNKPTGLSRGGETAAVARGVNEKERIKLVVVDSIASAPGVAYPWEEVTELCHKYGALSLVDAAHSIGQHKVDVKRADPDFFVTNMHKWLFTYVTPFVCQY